MTRFFKMRWVFALSLASLFSLSVFPGAMAQEDEITCQAGDVCRQAKTALPLRALPRAMSSIYGEPRDDAPVIASNVKAFWPVYVFQRKDLDFSDASDPKGWYEVGASATDKPVGWMKARDVFEWKQALVVSYTHPGTGADRRNPVLMYSDVNALKKVVEGDGRADLARVFYDGFALVPPKIPEGVVSAEPKRFVDIETQFYILPVLQFESLDIFDDAARYLQIAAAVPSERADAENPDTLQNQQFFNQTAAADTTQGTDAKTLGVDIKFVMDVTGSMGPYIEKTKEAVSRIADLVSAQDTTVRYGLVGYSDAVKNLTPELVDAAEFNRIISTVKADGGNDYQEEVFAGVREGIRSPWNENTLRMMVVVGDASSHPVGHPLNLTGMGEEEIRLEADQNNVTVFGIHLKAKAAAADHPQAEKQLKALSRNPGAEADVYFPFDADDLTTFEEQVSKVAGTLSESIAMVRKGATAVDTTIVEKYADPKNAAAGEAERDQALVDTINAALVQYLGSAAKPPRDITAWVLDKDLVDPNVRSLDVRVLVKRKELNDLIKALDQVTSAFKRAELTSQKFFDSLQGVVATGAKGEEISFQNAQKLVDVKLLPAWIESLPYKSAILNMNNEVWESLSPDERSKLEMDVEAKLKLYQDINENTTLWVALDERSASLDHVYPLSLDALP